MRASWKEVTGILTFALCVFIIPLISACGDAVHTSPETGKIAFSVEWRGAPTIQRSNASIRAAALDCETANVSTVEGKVYDENNVFLGGDVRDCEAHSGTITGIPVGSNRKLAIVGKDLSGNVLYRGEKTDITIRADETNDAGFIVAEPFHLALLIPSDGSTVTNGAFAFQWSDVTGTSAYQIQVSEDTSFGTTVIDETATDTYYVPTTTLSAGTHYWRVRAEDSYGNQSAWSDVWSFIVSAESGSTPSTPTNVSTITGNEEVTISWDSVSGATSYNIYWSTSPGVSKDTYEGKIEDITTTSYTHTELTNDTAYYYVVTAENSYGESGESNEVSATPSATGEAPSTPTNVTAIAGNEEVTISWDTVTDAISYNIYWSTSQGVTTGTGIKISTLSSPYAHTGLTNGTTYYYVVTAENSYGESSESTEVSTTPSAEGETPLALINVSAAAGDEQVTISWDTVTDATSYNIYWSTSQGVTTGTGIKISTLSSPYAHTGLTNGTTYYYVVTAENSYGESSESDEVSATPPWGDIENISTSGQWPSISIGPYDEVHIVWIDNGQVSYRQSRDGGFTWESTKQISTSGSTAEDVEIDVDSNGNVHIVWEYNLTPQIYYEKLDNDGNTLVNETNISQSSSFTEDPDITVDPNGYIHVVWGDNRNSPRDIRYRRSTDGGSSWDGSVEIGTASDDLYYPTIAADSDNVFVVITSHDTDAIYFAKSSTSGTSWGSMTVMDSINNVKYPDLYYFNGQLHLVYTASLVIYYTKSTDSGASWPTGTALTCFTSNGTYPGVAANSTGVYVTRYEGYFAESLDGGNEWSSEIDSGLGGNKWVKIDLDSSGNTHFVSDGVKYRRRNSS